MGKRNLVIAIAAAGLVGFAAFLLRNPSPRNNAAGVTPPPSPAGSAETAPSTPVMPQPKAPGGAVAPTNTVADAGSSPTDQEREQAYKDELIAKLAELSMNDDSDSLNTILDELSNRDPDIRKAALDATIQFGSRDAIPKLMDAAMQVEDIHEKAAIADAIEFLKLPSLTEVMQQRAAGATAPGQPAQANH